jgi:hypothetical protein
MPASYANIIQRFDQLRDWRHDRLFLEDDINLLYSGNLTILFAINLSLSLSVVQGLLLRLRECTVELTSHTGEMASIRTVAFRDGTL